jgi:tetratricopeptide (TPR) repeat protein
VARTPASTQIAFAAVLAATAWLVIFGGSFLGIYVAGLRAASVVMTAVALAAWGLVALRHPSWRPRSAIWPALAAPVAAFAVSTLLSRSPRVSAEYFGYTLLLVALYLLLRALLAHASFRERVAAAAVPFALVIGVVYVVACLRYWITWWDLVGAFRLPPLRPLFEGFTYGNPSAVLTMSILLTTAGAAHLGLGTPGRRVVVIGLAALAAIVTLLSGSRAGWLAVGVAVVVVAMAALASAAGRKALRSLVATRTARIGTALAGASGAAALLVLAPGILLRVGAGGEDLRATYVAVAGRLLAEAPATGTGAGTWVAQRIAMTAAGEPDYYIPHAHNIYAQTASEHGLLGLLAGAIAIGCLAWLILRGLRDADAVRRRWAWAAFFGTVYFGTHQVLDFYANFPATLFAFALPVAWLDATTPRSITARLRAPAVGPGTRRLLGGVAAAVGVGILAVAVVGLVAQERPAELMGRGQIAAGEGDWATALPLFRAAREADPQIPAYTFAQGLAEARAGDPASALEALERVAASDDLPVAWLDVAALRLDAGDTAGTQAALDRALRLGRQQPAILFAAGALLERLGDLPAADAAWSATLQALPSLAGDRWWTDPARADRWPAIRDAALAELSPEAAADLWLSSGDSARATEAAARIADPAARKQIQLAIAAWFGDPADRAALDSYARDHPFDMSAVAWAGRVAGRVGAPEQVGRYRLWADIVAGTASGAVGEIRVALAGSEAVPAGLNGTFWGQYTYRRPTPADQLVPSLPHLVLTP